MSRVKHSKQLNKKLIFCESRKEENSLTRLSKLVFKYIKNFELLYKK